MFIDLGKYEVKKVKECNISYKGRTGISTNISTDGTDSNASTDIGTSVNQFKLFTENSLNSLQATDSNIWKHCMRPLLLWASLTLP